MSLESDVRKTEAWLRSTADGWERDVTLYASPAVREQIELSVRTLRMAADDLAKTVEQNTDSEPRA